jgi:hypothetical protein
MAISSKRFSIIGEETNLSITNLDEIEDAFIRNDPDADYSEISAELEDFVQDMMDEVPFDYEDDIDEATRATKDLIADMKDVDLLDVKQMDKRVQDLFPDNPIARSVFTQMSDKCKRDPLSMQGLGKPYDPSVSCNGRKTNTKNNSCNAGKYGDILNKLTGGAYNSSYEDLNGMLKKVMALASFGYKMNMCGVFNAVTKDMTNKPMLSRASAGLLGMLSKSSNSLGALDVIAGSTGLSPLRELPGALSMTLSSFKMPSGMKEFDMAEMSDRMMGGAELLDGEFDRSENMLSISEFGDYNEDLSDIMTARRTAIAIDEDSLDFIPDSDQVFLSSAYEASGTDGFYSDADGLVSEDLW